MDEIVNFLRKYVNGKTLYTDEITYSLENGRLRGTYSDQISFSNMFFSKTRFTLDKFIVSKEKQIDDKTGEIVKEENSSCLYRYSLAKRQNTEEVTGIMTLAASSLMSGPIQTESNAWAVYDLKIKNNEFSWTEEQMLNRDLVGGDWKFRQVANRAKCRIFLTKEGLIYEFEPEFFDFDMVARERTPSASGRPVFVSKERRI